MSNNANTNTKETSSVNPFQAKILMDIQKNKERRDRLNGEALSGELNTVNRVSDESGMYLSKQFTGTKRRDFSVPQQITLGQEIYEENHGKNDDQVMQEDDYQSVLAALKAQEVAVRRAQEAAALKAAALKKAEADKKKEQAEIKEKKKKKRQEILMRFAPSIPYVLMILLLIVLTIFMIFAIAALFEL